MKPGDLALIISSGNPENIGRVVTVEQPIKAGEFFFTDQGFTDVTRDGFVVRGEIVVSRTISGERFTVDRHPFRTSWLMPLRGEPEQKKVTEHAHQA